MKRIIRITEKDNRIILLDHPAQPSFNAIEWAKFERMFPDMMAFVEHDSERKILNNNIWINRK